MCLYVCAVCAVCVCVVCVKQMLKPYNYTFQFFMTAYRESQIMHVSKEMAFEIIEGKSLIVGKNVKLSMVWRHPISVYDL